MSAEVLCVGHAAYDLSVFVEKFPEENTKVETAESLESGGLGEEGLIVDDGSGFRHGPAFFLHMPWTSLAQATFFTAFAFAITRAMPFWESLRFMAMTASLSVRVPGGRGSIPTLSQVEEALAHVG